jgi:putative nucleotidyltransferase with HDIG domain
VKSLLDFSDPLPCNIHLKLNEQKFVVMFKKDTVIEHERLKKYISKGVLYLYVSEDEKGILTSVTNKIDFLDEKVLGTEEIELLEDKLQNIGSENLKKIEQNTEELTKTCISDLFRGTELNHEHINNTIKLIKEYVSVMATAPDQIAKLLNNIDKNSYFHYHSVSVSVLSIFITKVIKQNNDRMQEIVGMGGFLHDIGKSGSKDHELNPIVNPDITTQKKYLQHPDTGFKLLKELHNVPEEVKIIVHQHHERPDGLGFPRNVFNVRLYHPSKVVAVANEFSKLISDSPFGNSKKPAEAIQILNSRSGAYDREIISTLAKLYKTPIGGT